LGSVQSRAGSGFGKNCGRADLLPGNAGLKVKTADMREEFGDRQGESRFRAFRGHA